MRRIVDALIAFARRTPYLHLYHADGSPYMERFWVIRTRWFMVKLHHICSPDYDRHMHDHPWAFASLVLRGWYVEERPEFDPPVFDASGREYSIPQVRSAGSFAFRALGERHLITRVSPGGVWTLFLNGPKGRKWGFHTERGWVQWDQYDSVHQAGQAPQ